MDYSSNSDIEAVEEIALSDKEKEIIELQKKLGLELLPTNKPHISFSETKCWWDCSWKHWLQHVKEIDLDVPSSIPCFGTAMHACCEHFATTREVDLSIIETVLRREFDTNKDVPNAKGFDEESFQQYLKEGAAIMAELPAFMDNEFTSWTLCSVEHQLYEKIDNHPQAFKGYIDLVIDAIDKKGKQITWILDFKTCAWGWTTSKKSDPKYTTQLFLYKDFYAKKFNLPQSRVKCGFILLKRTAKDGNHCEFVYVSSGDKTCGRSVQLVRDALGSIKRGTKIKMRASCKYCPYHNTEHCTSSIMEWVQKLRS